MSPACRIPAARSGRGPLPGPRTPCAGRGPEAGEVAILLLGDSTVIGSVCRRRAPKADHLEDVLRKLLAAEGDLPPAEVINQGRDGEYIHGLLEGRYARDIARLPLDFVLIRYGLNDRGRRKDFATNFPKDCRELIRRLKQDHPNCQIVLETVIPTSSKDGNKSINDLVRGVAAAEKLPLLDTHARFAAELKHGPNLLTYRRVRLDRVPEKYDRCCRPARSRAATWW